MRISDWSSDVCSSDLAVDKEHVSIVVIDSLNGYLNAMPGEQFLIIQLHELLSFLGQRGIATLMASAHHGLIGNNMSATVDVSYRSEEGRVRKGCVSTCRVRGEPEDKKKKKTKA